VNPGYYCTLDINNTQVCFEICGDGKHLGLNECDDGNTLNRDGCSHNCTIETGFVCETIKNSMISNCSEICGDLRNFGKYQCDSGMIGCSQCQV
jgi:cysteine-rich repeat protein